MAPVRSFKDEDEAAALAAASAYGLALGIVTRDAARGLELARRIPTGIVHINDQTVNDEAVAPSTGWLPPAPVRASAATPISTPSPASAGSPSAPRRRVIRTEIGRAHV